MDGVISVIDVVGCCVSSFAMVVTCVSLIALWKYVKSFHTIVTFNLCFALVAANGLYAAGMNRIKASEEDYCMANSALLHFFVLVPFFLLTAQALYLPSHLELYPSQKQTQSYLLPFVGWFMPAVVVGVTLAVTQLDNYKATTYCWVDFEKPVMYSLVGPVGATFLINMLAVVGTSCQARDHHASRKMRTASIGICILMPLLAATWIFAAFSSIRQHEVFWDYLFASFNILVGAYFVIFHWVSSPKVQNVFRGKDPSLDRLSLPEDAMVFSTKVGAKPDSVANGNPYVISGSRDGGSAGGIDGPYSKDEYVYHKRMIEDLYDNYATTAEPVQDYEPDDRVYSWHEKALGMDRMSLPVLAAQPTDNRRSSHKERGVGRQESSEYDQIEFTDNPGHIRYTGRPKRGFDI